MIISLVLLLGILAAVSDEHAFGRLLSCFFFYVYPLKIPLVFLTFSHIQLSYRATLFCLCARIKCFLSIIYELVFGF